MHTSLWQASAAHRWQKHNASCRQCRRPMTPLLPAQRRPIPRPFLHTSPHGIAQVRLMPAQHGSSVSNASQLCGMCMARARSASRCRCHLCDPLDSQPPAASLCAFAASGPDGTYHCLAESSPPPPPLPPSNVSCPALQATTSQSGTAAACTSCRPFGSSCALCTARHS